MEEIEVFSVGMAIRQVEEALNKGEYETARNVGSAVLKDDTLLGDRNDFHNLAVVFTRNDDYLTGYEIVRKGLEQYPYDIDLLADAIYYGSYCKKYSECEELIDTLRSRPRYLWNWRAFTFLADYYLDKMNWTENEDELLNLADFALVAAQDFQRCIPDDERGYSLEFKVREVRARFALLIDNQNLTDATPEDMAKKEMELAEKALETAIERTDMTAMQCCLRFADYLLEHRRYKEAIDCCSHAVKYAETQPTANLSYIMYISALSKDSLIHENEDYDDEERVQDAYRDYLVALKTADRQNNRSTIQKRCLFLQSKTGVEMPNELLNELQDEGVGMSRLIEMLSAQQG